MLLRLNLVFVIVFFQEQEMATKCFKADPDLLSIAIVWHLADPCFIKFRKWNIIS
jgi:hypothetical protein